MVLRWFSLHGALVSSPAPVSFTQPLSIKLDDQNFLLWNQQVEAVITAHKLHQFVVNPLIPLKYALETDRDWKLPHQALSIYTQRTHAIQTKIF